MFLLCFSGPLSSGTAGFLGESCYATGKAMAIWGFATMSGSRVGTAVGSGVGLIMGALAIRRSGIDFAMITLAMAQMVFFFFLQADFTGGEDGLQGIPLGSFLGIDFGNDDNLYYLVMVIFVAGYALILRAINSPLARMSVV